MAGVDHLIRRLNNQFLQHSDKALGVQWAHNPQGGCSSRSQIDILVLQTVESQMIDEILKIYVKTTDI